MKESVIAFIFSLTFALNIFAKEHKLEWVFKAKHGDTSFITNVNSYDKYLTISHHFSGFSYSTLMNGVANNDLDACFLSSVQTPTYLSIEMNNQAIIYHGENSATTINLFPLMYNQIVSSGTTVVPPANSTPVSAGLVPIPFLPASSEHLNGAMIASITPSQNTVQVSLNFLEELQCDNCVTNLILTQESDGYSFTVHHSGSLEGEPHHFTLTTHISAELMSILINGETAIFQQSDNAFASVSSLGVLLFGTHIASGP